MAFTPVFIDGAEHGIDFDLLDLRNGGGLFTSALGGVTSVLQTQNGGAVAGSFAYRFQTTSQSFQLLRDDLSASGLWEGCFKMRRSATPSTTIQFFQIGNVADNAAAVFRLNTSNQIVASLYNGSFQGAQTGPTLTLDAWNLIEFSFDFSTSTWTIKWKVNTVEQTDATFAAAGSATQTILSIGSWSANTCDIYLDDIVLASGSVAEHPVGDHYVLGFKPNAVGTHNLEASPSNSFYKDVADAETALTSAETTSYQTLEESPMFVTADHIVVDPDGALTSSHYAEYGLADAAGTPIAVRGIALLSQDTALADTIVVRLREGGSNFDIYSGAINVSGTNIETALTVTKPSGGAWTRDAFNSTTMRYGFSTDVDGRVRLHSFMVEAAFPATEPATPGLRVVSSPLRW